MGTSVGAGVGDGVGDGVVGTGVGAGVGDGAVGAGVGAGVALHFGGCGARARGAQGGAVSARAKGRRAQPHGVAQLTFSAAQSVHEHTNPLMWQKPENGYTPDPKLQ